MTEQVGLLGWVIQHRGWLSIVSRCKRRELLAHLGARCHNFCSASRRLGEIAILHGRWAHGIGLRRKNLSMNSVGQKGKLARAEFNCGGGARRLDHLSGLGRPHGLHLGQSLVLLGTWVSLYNHIETLLIALPLLLERNSGSCLDRLRVAAGEVAQVLCRLRAGAIDAEVMKTLIDASRRASRELSQQIYIFLMIEEEPVMFGPASRVRRIGPPPTSFCIAHIPQAEHAFIDGLQDGLVLNEVNENFLLADVGEPVELLLGLQDLVYGSGPADCRTYLLGACRAGLGNALAVPLGLDQGFDAVKK